MVSTVASQDVLGSMPGVRLLSVRREARSQVIGYYRVYIRCSVYYTMAAVLEMQFKV